MIERDAAPLIDRLKIVDTGYVPFTAIKVLRKPEDIKQFIEEFAASLQSSKLDVSHALSRARKSGKYTMEEFAKLTISDAFVSLSVLRDESAKFAMGEAILRWQKVLGDLITPYNNKPLNEIWEVKSCLADYGNKILSRYVNPDNDLDLTEESAKEIEEAWQLIWHINDGPKYYKFVDPENENRVDLMGRNIDVIPFSPEDEGYTFCPVRITEKEGMGDMSVHSEIHGSIFAKDIRQAILRAKRVANHSASSWVRGLIKAEVLLSGPLKFEGQKRPVWFPFRLLTEQEWEETYREGLNFLKERGYEF